MNIRKNFADTDNNISNPHGTNFDIAKLAKMIHKSNDLVRKKIENQYKNYKYFYKLPSYRKFVGMGHYIVY